MAKIKSKSDLVNFIKMKLGYPQINIEVTDEQMRICIDQAVQKFCDYAYDGILEEAVILQINGKGDYPLPENITHILKVSKGSSASNITSFGTNFGQGYVPDVWSSLYFSSATAINGSSYGTSITGSILPAILMVSNISAITTKYFEDILAYHFNPAKHVLQVTENYSGAVLIHYNYEYDPDEEHDKIFNHQWVKEYATALVKEIWGSVTGKYSQALVGGAQINYADMKSEAQQEKDRLDEQLMSRWTDPVPIEIG